MHKIYKISIIHPASNLPRVMADAIKCLKSQNFIYFHFIYLSRGEDKMLFVGVSISCILLFLVFI